MDDASNGSAAPWDEVAPNLANAFGAPSSALLLSTGVVTTLVASPSGIDHALRVGARRNFGSDAYGDVAVLAGYVAPIVIPIGIHAGGLLSSQRGLALHGAAAVQAVVVSFTSTRLLKVITGRPFPLHGGDPQANDRYAHPEYAGEWLSSPFDGNVAWPSGHASAAFALASSLSASTASVPVTVVSYSAATAIAVGMIVGDRHWSSDVIAGALLGQAVGDAIGRGFRARFRGASGDDTTRSPFVVVPRVTGSEVGLSLFVTAFR